MGTKVVFISSLLPEKGVSPIYEVLMKEQIEMLGGDCVFYSAQDMLDEFGDGMAFAPMIIYVLSKSLAKTGQIIISLHPTLMEHYNIMKEARNREAALTKLEYQWIELSTVMRNTSAIYRCKQEIAVPYSGYTVEDAKTSTVLGVEVKYIQYSGDIDEFYTKAVDAVGGEKKFVCFVIDNYKFDYRRLQAELKKRKIPGYKYLDKGDKNNLTGFLSSPKGCLVTKYIHARGTEATTLLVFTDGKGDKSRVLRGTTHLVYADMKGGKPDVDVTEPTPGHQYIQGCYRNPLLWSKLLDTLIKKEVKKYVLIIGGYLSKKFLILLEEELKRRGLEPPIDRTNLCYSVEDMRTHLQRIDEGCVVYTEEYGNQRCIKDECLDWLARNTTLVYVHSSINIRSVDKRILSCKPELFIQVLFRGIV